MRLQPLKHADSQCGPYSRTKCHHVVSVARTKWPTAAAGTGPVPFRPILGEHPQVGDDAVPVVRYSQCIGISFFETLIKMRPLTKRPFTSLLEPILSEKEFLNWPV